MSGLGYVGLTLVSCQKIFIFLGDLARYREMASDTSNYGKAKSWYTKANLANPKNGRPYNQLAILALYAVSSILICSSRLFDVNYNLFCGSMNFRGENWTLSTCTCVA